VGRSPIALAQNPISGLISRDFPVDAFICVGNRPARLIWILTVLHIALRLSGAS